MAHKKSTPAMAPCAATAHYFLMSERLWAAPAKRDMQRCSSSDLRSDQSPQASHGNHSQFLFTQHKLLDCKLHSINKLMKAFLLHLVLSGTIIRAS